MVSLTILKRQHYSTVQNTNSESCATLAPSQRVGIIKFLQLFSFCLGITAFVTWSNKIHHRAEFMWCFFFLFLFCTQVLLTTCKDLTFFSSHCNKTACHLCVLLDVFVYGIDLGIVSLLLCLKTQFSKILFTLNQRVVKSRYEDMFSASCCPPSSFLNMKCCLACCSCNRKCNAWLVLLW